MSTSTANFGLVKPELTDAADITMMNDNWDKVDKLLKSSIVEAVLSANSWKNSVYTWSNENIISANQLIELLPSQSITSEQLEVLQGANIIGTSQAIGSVTFTAHGETPTIDIPVVFIIKGVL
jgi:hypothetical protein